MNSNAREVAADAIDEWFVARCRSGAASVELDGELVLAAPEVGAQLDVHWLDRTATLVWQTLDGASTLADLIDELAEAFGADRTAVRDDVVQLARTLGRAGLLDGVAYEPPAPAHARRPVGLGVGTTVPTFGGPDIDGASFTSTELRGTRACLVNWNPTCGFCSNIAGELARLVPALEARGVALILVTSGDRDENRRLLDAHGLRCRVLLDEGHHVELFESLGTPCAYLVTADGTIEAGLAYGGVEVTDLLQRVASGG